MTNLFKEGGNDENQSTNDLLQIQIRPITRVRAKKLQEACNGLVNEFIWANLAFKEEFNSNQAFEELEPTRKFKS